MRLSEIEALKFGRWALPYPWCLGCTVAVRVGRGELFVVCGCSNGAQVVDLVLRLAWARVRWVFKRAVVRHTKCLSQDEDDMGRQSVKG